MHMCNPSFLCFFSFFFFFFFFFWGGGGGGRGAMIFFLSEDSLLLVSDCFYGQRGPSDMRFTLKKKYFFRELTTIVNGDKKAFRERPFNLNLKLSY